MAIMTSVSTRKRKSSFSLRDRFKVRIVSASPPPSPASSTNSSIEKHLSTLRRKASRVFTVLRLTSKPDALQGALLADWLGHSSPRCTSIPPGCAAEVSVVEEVNPDNAAAALQAEKASLSQSSSSKSDCPQDNNEHRAYALDGSNEPTSWSVPAATPTTDSHRLPSSKPAPGLTGQLSQKPSAETSQPSTIIHRPHCRGRHPSIVPLDAFVVSCFQSTSRTGFLTSMRSSSLALSRTSRNIPSPPPSLPSSTTPISLHCSGNSRQTETNLTIQQTSLPGHEAFLTTINEMESSRLGVTVNSDWQSIRPSILTVEKAAAAKIFLETFFNLVWSSPASDRSLRRRRLDRKLISLQMSLEDREMANIAWIKAESEHLRQIRAIKSRYRAKNKTCAARYEVLRVLGKGSFGVVRLVREIHRQSSEVEQDAVISPTDCCSVPDKVKAHRRDLSLLKKQVYAMKVIRKSEMFRNSQEGHLRAERDFLVASAHSRWVVPLVSAFQDQSYLYLVMEYMVGGDFMSFLQREDMLTESSARCYVAEMILCIEEAHKMKWIHRDVKPDNFLIGANGHLKISDFGLAFDGHWSHWQQYHNNTREELLDRCNLRLMGDDEDIAKAENDEGVRQARVSAGKQSQKPARLGRPEPESMIVDQLNVHGRRRLAHSIVGTSHYMAPEVIAGDYYDGRCDWWSIGVILYECLFGCTPFYDENRERTKRKIVEHRNHLRFPDKMRQARPDSAYSQILPPVTLTAIDLIVKLLTDREKRLSSRRYRDNDIRGRPSSRNNRCKPQHQAYFVFANDAEDIKAHPFFHHIDWDTHHLSRPPFIPRVSSDQPITKYFEDEDAILGDCDISSSRETSKSTVDEMNKHANLEQLATAGCKRGVTQPTKSGRSELLNKSLLPLLLDVDSQQAPPTGPDAVKNQKLFQGLTPPTPSPSHAPIKLANGTNKKRRADIRRPRDKILRDPATAKPAMEIRKSAAFLGYTYRRPDMGALLGPDAPEDDMGAVRRVRPVRASVLPTVEVGVLGVEGPGTGV